MRVLIVSAYFPPEETIGALRPAALARHLESSGHDVFVLSCAIPGQTNEEGTVKRTPGFHMRRLRVDRGSTATSDCRKARRPTPQVGAPEAPPGSFGLRAKTILRRTTSTAIRELLDIPDPYVGWIPYAIRQGKRLTKSESCDLIIASGPPFSTFMIAASLAGKTGLPWCADYRDLWTLGPYYRRSRVRRAIDRALERRLIRSASLVTTVSEPLAQDLREAFNVRVQSVRNGFDDADLVGDEDRPPLSSARVNIAYAGNSLYEGYRSPAVLFEAARDLGLSPREIRFHFIGTDPTSIEPLAGELGIGPLLNFVPRMNRGECLIIESRADALLLLLGNDPSEAGIYSGKLFEYAGTRRPIILVGYRKGVAADAIREFNLGWVVSDVDSARATLLALLDRKPSAGLLDPIPIQQLKGLSRVPQLEQWMKLMEDVAMSRSRLP